MRLISITVLVLAALFGAYYFWWNTVSETAQSEWAKWKEAKKSEGFDITHQPIRSSGFPYRVRLDIDDLKVTKNGDENISINAENLWAIAQPWQLKHVILGTDSQWQISVGDKAYTATTESGLASLRFNSDGKLQILATDIKKLSITEAGSVIFQSARSQLHAIPTVTEVKASNGEAKASDQMIDGWRVAIRVDEISGELQNLKNASISTVIDGNPAQLLKEETAQIWRDAGNAIEVTELKLQLKDSNVTAKGTITLDQDNYPLGAFTSEIAGYESIMPELGKRLGVRDKDMSQMLIALSLIAQKNEKGESVLKLPVSLQSRAIYLGPIKLSDLKPIY